MLRSIATAIAVFPTADSAASAEVSDAARAELAPTGELRVGMNLGNVLVTTKEAATGKLTGVSVDAMRELAARLNGPVVFVIHAAPGDVADAVNKDTSDLAVLAIAQARAKTIAFSPAMTETEATYEVHKDSTLSSAGQVVMRPASASLRQRKQTMSSI